MREGYPSHPARGSGAEPQLTTVPCYSELWQYSLTLFNGEDRHARGPLSLVPSLFLDSSVNPDECINDMLKWALNPL